MAQLAALDYTDLGYRIFPCVPDGKRPIPTRGLKEATTDAEQIERWWQQYPAANIGLCTDDLLVVDIDPLADGGSNPWLSGDYDKAADLAVAPIGVTPRGGKHFLFRQPAGYQLGNSASKLAPHVDTRATGGYIVVAPSKIGANSYRWVSGSLDLRPDELPEPPWWLLAALSEAAVSGTSGTRADKPAGPANKIPKGQRNDALFRIGCMMRRGGMSEAEILAGLTVVNRDRCEPPVDLDELRQVAASSYKYDPEQAVVAVNECWAEQDRESNYDYLAGPADPGKFPEKLLTVPGYLGEVIDHNLSCAYKRQPVLALAGALSLMATLTGRKITDASGTRTNLYAIGVSGTSTGKERAREVNKEILRLAGLDKLIGAESIGSSAGLVSAVEKEPAILFQVDEIGRYLKTLADAHQSHLYNILTVLMKLFTSSSTLYVGDAYADTNKVKRINQPHACLYGTTTPTTFLESLTSDSLTDGFLSRVLVFEGDESAVRNDVVKRSIPDCLINTAKWWRNEFKPGGNLATEFPQPLIVEVTPEAKSVFADLDAVAEEQRKTTGEPLGLLWPRTLEKAHKLALLWACSEVKEAPIVDSEAAEWACEVVKYLTARLSYLASIWISENKVEANFKRLARIVESAGPAGVNKWQLGQKTRFLVKRDREELLMALIESGEVVEQLTPSATKPTMTYRHRRFVNK